MESFPYTKRLSLPRATQACSDDAVSRALLPYVMPIDVRVGSSSAFAWLAFSSMIIMHRAPPRHTASPVTRASAHVCVMVFERFLRTPH